MIERRFSGPRPATRLPAGTVDTQTHMFLPGFPSLPPGPPLPEGLPGPEDYRQVMGWLGIDRVVITQGNAHQFDNANLVACLAAMGDVARGVAAIRPDAPEAELEALHAAGVRGARVMNLPGGAAGIDALPAIDARAAAMGWCVAVQLDGNRIGEHEALLAGLKSRWILDHHGKFFAGAVPDGPEIATVRRLVDRGNCWFKFAGAYESSRTGPPDYTDVAAIARLLAAEVPERILWGTNWPHNLAKTTADYPDDAALLDTVVGWIPEHERTRVLALNPAALFGFDD